jgi:hypothetical protein
MWRIFGVLCVNPKKIGFDFLKKATHPTVLLHGLALGSSH